MSEIKAIETRYGGYHFRSRLEARWAVFLDGMNASWDYEPEGFVVGSRPYLPDFLIADRLLLEVKPASYEFTKPDKEMYRAIAMVSQIIVARGSFGRSIDLTLYDPDFSPDGKAMSGLSIAECRKCGALCFASNHPEAFFTMMLCKAECTSEKVLIDGECIASATKAATSARFEHGQSGAT